MADLRTQMVNTKLKQQIKFMKDLINSAKEHDRKHTTNAASVPVRHRANLSWTAFSGHSRSGEFGRQSGYHGSHLGKSARGRQANIPHLPKTKQIDTTKYSFIRSASAPVNIQSEGAGKLSDVHASKPSTLNQISHPSCSNAGKESDTNSSSSKTPVHKPIDLNTHSLESLKKILADKMEAKAKRKARIARKQHKAANGNITQDKKNDSKSLSDTCTPKPHEHQMISQQQKNDHAIQTDDSLVKPSGWLKTEPSEMNVVKKLPVNRGSSQLPTRRSKISETTGGLPNKSTTPIETTAKVSKTSANIASQASVKGSECLSGLSQLSPLLLPSKGDLAKGLQSTEAKIKELTAELTKLKEVAKIVSLSPTKQNQKPRKINSSSSTYKLNCSSSNSSYNKALYRKAGQSNTQHAARYVMSKYKLNKIHIKMSADMKPRSNGKPYYLKKRLKLFHSKQSSRHNSKFRTNAYCWTKAGKAAKPWKNRSQVDPIMFPPTRWSKKPHKMMTQNAHGKYKSLAWMPFWKRKLVLQESFRKRRTVWHKDDRDKLSSSAVYMKRNPYLPRQRVRETSSKGLSGVRTISVHGVKFQIGSTGRTLQRVESTGNSSTDQQSRKSISRVDFRGVTYRETKPGMLEKSSSYQSRVRASQALHKSIAVSTGKHKMSKTKRQYCMFFCRFGKCNRGDNCTFIHDPDKVAVCTRFLRGTCKVDNCPFSHKVSKEKMPVCSYFLKGGCVREDCPYSHVNVSRDAKVCRDFLRGFCPRGDKCKEKHILECPEFARSGKCPLGKQCKLEHRKRSAKSQISTKQISDSQPNRVNQKREERAEARSSNQNADNSPERGPVPFQMLRLPAFISIVSSDDSPSSPDASTPPVVNKPQEQLRIKPRI